MITATVKSYAKLNLTLDITGVENGYHNLDSLVCTIDICDTLFLKKRKDTLVNVYMRGKGSENIPPERNNAVKAGEAFVKEFSTCGADITILKEIPIGGGLGGSSADIAGVLNGLAKLYGVEKEYPRLKRIADSLGSDSGYLLSGGFARIQGRGEKVTKVQASTPLHFLLIEPKNGVSAKDCFMRYDEEGKNYLPTTQQALDLLQKGDIKNLSALLKNDLQSSACSLCNDVKIAIEEGESFSPLSCVMTGSGSCVFLLFENEEFCRWAKSRYRGKFKVRLVKSVEPNQKQQKNSLYSLTEEEELLLKGD